MPGPSGSWAGASIGPWRLALLLAYPVANILPYIPRMIRCHFKWYDGAGHYGSRLFFQGSSNPFTLSDLNAFATELATSWHTRLGPTTNSAVSLVEVTAVDISASTGLQGIWQGSQSGSKPGYLPSAATCINVRALIAEHYRGGHPVTHHPPPAGQDLTNSRTWDSGVAASVTAGFSAWMLDQFALTGGTVGSAQHVVLLGYRPGAAPSAVKVSSPGSYLASTRVGTMRKRLSAEA